MLARTAYDRKKLEVDGQKLYDTDYLRSMETPVEKLRVRDDSNID
ncbi:hypothetical protein [Microcoleus sp. F4-D5]